ncbi:hypothetical protein HHK36_025763 [Tetracentron sinense]|uniref:MAPK kinase substrate protein n=1 Tax=Tetracentron sinense TaxID=13715 RepID=A0A834YM10_TETSI|nr:hypothetical protein HHK36_025763 [Tetracentron sinense]
MDGLQRSAMSFRRSGSSGLVWEDSQSVDVTVPVMERSQSNGGRGYRTGKVSPAMDPPSPKVSGCGFCGIFGKPVKSRRPRSGKRNW